MSEYTDEVSSVSSDDQAMLKEAVISYAQKLLLDTSRESVDNPCIVVRVGMADPQAIQQAAQVQYHQRTCSPLM